MAAFPEQVKLKIVVEAQDPVQFSKDVQQLYVCAAELRKSARSKVRMAPLAEQVAGVIEQIAVNLSKVELASR